MQVHVYVTISLVTEAGYLHHALPLNNDAEPVFIDDDLIDEIQACCKSMKDWKISNNDCD